MWWYQQGLSFLPSALVILISAACVFPYIIGVLLHHVDPLLPYISDLGTTPPERSLFGITFCFTSMFCIATVYVRYKQVSALNPEEPKLLRLNKAGLAFGMVSCLGIFIIANFQKNVIYVIHAVGAFLVFGIGIIYFLVQTIISYKMQPQIHGKDIFWIRFTILLWGTVNLVICILCGKPGFTFHIIAIVSEWSLLFTFIIYFLTFIRDFQVKHSEHLRATSHGETGRSSTCWEKVSRQSSGNSPIQHLEVLTSRDFKYSL
uniref:CWH43-like N-terminal domain-containing protein n=1 Tax=Pseudonaja textilis TaxID=8673 RepID=A0A670ZDL2_PSETE